jgi:hypothetical protein
LPNVPTDRRGPYRVSVVRPGSPRAEVYRAPLREPLPGIRIPLRPQDPDAALDLQDLINRSYENGRYGRGIDYRRDPEPPLHGDDAAWADQLLRQQGRR